MCSLSKTKSLLYGPGKKPSYNFFLFVVRLKCKKVSLFGLWIGLWDCLYVATASNFPSVFVVVAFTNPWTFAQCAHILTLGSFCIWEKRSSSVYSMHVWLSFPSPSPTNLTKSVDSCGWALLTLTNVPVVQRQIGMVARTTRWQTVFCYLNQVLPLPWSTWIEYLSLTTADKWETYKFN